MLSGILAWPLNQKTTVRDTGNLRNLVGKQAIPADSLAVTVRCKLPEGSTEGNTVSPNQPTMDESYNNYNSVIIKVVRILRENSKTIEDLTMTFLL